MNTRVAVISKEKCKPSNCRKECKNNCPVVRMGKMCIEFDQENRSAKINENLCIGCTICVKKCPFNAIKIINLPLELKEDPIHKYGDNSFQLFRLPAPRQGKILGLIGSNGIGKSTALKILSRHILPNFGQFNVESQVDRLKKQFRGKHLQKFIDSIFYKKAKILMKPQYIDSLPETIKGNIKTTLMEKKERKDSDKMLEELSLHNLFQRKANELSGGEMQRLSIAFLMIQNCDCMIIDELSSYLDLKQKVLITKIIRRRVQEDTDLFVIASEHDLSITDYLSDFLCCMFGVPGAFGIASVPYPVNEGINNYLAGFLPIENLRFRESLIDFSKLSRNLENISEKSSESYVYPKLEKTMGNFRLVVNKGSIKASEILILLGENGTGKSTYLKLISGFINPDPKYESLKPIITSYKPQKISPSYEGTVEELLDKKLGKILLDEYFMQNIYKGLEIEILKPRYVKNLSGGEIQRVAILLCLAKKAQIYIIDEPSAYLDIDQRISISKILKNFSRRYEKPILIVDHDFMMASYLADRIIVFSGTPGRTCTADSPLSVNIGFNNFLEDLEITFRKDSISNRPRINKANSIKDTEQKLSGSPLF